MGTRDDDAPAQEGRSDCCPLKNDKRQPTKHLLKKKDARVPSTKKTGELDPMVLCNQG